MKNQLYNLIIAMLLLLIGATAKDIYTSYLLPVNNEMSSVYIMVKGKPSYIGELQNISTADSTTTLTIKTISND